MKRRFLSLAVLVLTMAAVLIAVTGTTAGAVTLVLPTPKLELAQPQDSDITDTSIRLSWNVVVSAEQYVVYRKPYVGEYEAVTYLAPGTTSYTDKGLKNGSIYYYKVGAATVGFGTLTSNEVEASTSMPCPTDLRATADSSGAITLTWKDNCNSEDLWIITYNGRTERRIL